MAAPRIMRGSKDVRRGVALWAAKNATFVLVLAAILLLGSGDRSWPAGRVYLLYTAGYLVVLGTVLYRVDPTLLAERSGVQEGAKTWDLALASLTAVWLPVLVYATAAASRRGDWAPHVPFAVQAGAMAIVLLGSAVVLWAMAVNTYFSAVVRIQVDRGHRVVASGPYRWLRHPGYLG